MWTSDTVAGSAACGGQGDTVRGASRVRAGWSGAQHVARHVGGVSRVGCRVWQSELTFLSS